MAIKLDRNKQWISSKRFLLESCGISVHFSEIHSNYYSTWKYVTKEDKHYIQSLDHPDLTNTGPPRTTMASIAAQSRSKKKASHVARFSVITGRTTSSPPSPEQRHSNFCDRKEPHCIRKKWHHQRKGDENDDGPMEVLSIPCSDLLVENVLLC